VPGFGLSGGVAVVWRWRSPSSRNVMAMMVVVELKAKDEVQPEIIWLRRQVCPFPKSVRFGPCRRSKVWGLDFEEKSI
jgi:hypothetical protein